ncbi:Alpha/Beta hydrolase protein [Microdochium trichocladiopsis]|uniref:Alpha/Beta hydrolase protein n=1 Tax=Microdochium trichocladiopsis TaxID=1682393 RepID=A0A9P9BWS8_9PEZI|nr:Alpha/Beta hydrolase protein [Microdochium trichocladiopsis]KAH7041082.1 Alpha/Beta hydrolase protein [Microdochium trichocladiopsis]
MFMLGPVSALDCIAFCVFLAIQLPLQVGLFETLGVLIPCLPFLLLKLPFQFLKTRFLVPAHRQPPFVAVASPFEDFVIRCVRYAFSNIPPKIGRVFFSKAVALPFLRFRLLRHGFLKTPLHWREYGDGERKRFKGIWIIQDPTKRPDCCIFYAHGGGFMMGSSYFYLEFLLTWLSLLSESGYKNPAIFSLEYTLVPDACFPTQLNQSIAAYEHVSSMVGDASKICVAGDSAGAGIVLTLLFHIARPDAKPRRVSYVPTYSLQKPGFAVLISPWVTMVSPLHRNTESDYLEASHLHGYAKQYAGGAQFVHDPLISPGSCRDVDWWSEALPSRGVHLTYGAEEMLAAGIADLEDFLRRNSFRVTQHAEAGEIHAWPVASLFLCNTIDARKKGLADIVKKIKENITSDEANEGK